MSSGTARAEDGVPDHAAEIAGAVADTAAVDQPVRRRMADA